MNLISKALIIGLTSLSFSATAVAKELTTDDVRALQSSIKASESLSVDFTQTTTKALRGTKVVRKGKAAFARPNKFKWMLEAPANEQKIYDGKFFYDYTPATKSAAKLSPTGPQAHELNGIVDLILNFDTLLKRYDMVKAEENGDEVRIELKPKTGNEVTAVELKLTKKDPYITFLKMDLKGGNTQTHQFTNPSRAALPADTFKLPEGVKVTDSN